MRRRGVVRSGFAKAVAVAVVLGLTSSMVGCRHSRPEAAAPAAQPTSSVGHPADPVDQLVVARPDPGVPQYRRAAFGDGWAYDPESGCNTRERVLVAESEVAPTFGEGRCHPVRGRWTSTYDGVVTTDPQDLEIDHVVPLADAWRSGAAGWSAERRRTFANDTLHPDVLAAVTSSTNRSKGDDTPDQWLPPDRASWCDYARAWVQVKARYRLSVTPPEKATLVGILNGC